MDEVGEDRSDQWWGTRGAQWARFQHKTEGKTVFMVNHHGPLPVGTGGLCGRHATAWNILRTIGTHADQTDVVVLVGDFNADASTLTVQEVGQRLHKLYTGSSFGGVDHIFSSCGEGQVVTRRNLGGGGSDHDALDVVLKI
uniref:Endonuclease/exonuclease/phosphatase domain-containing protein n=1 Tax=Zooxanthella nutricula TaxID=1333877 RepID=A0A7S2JVN7_9DINO|mmetsp:Transcript_36336/g.109850  ORF Transcript_36336/g.109850 Transcript_36336/m.109850 type:complete len:141 (+) Transcript_36336:1-423(+)